MHAVKASKKMGESILISWEENGSNHFEAYTFQELQDLKVNALDLLDRPMSYQVDPATRSIAAKKK
jgi:hypothetical protein